MQKILLLEDDITLGSGIRLALQSPSVQITLCRTLAQSLGAVADNSYDLLILDVNLPDGSGLDLLGQIRKTSHVPVILLTANDLEMDVVTGLESGADDYITKPFSLAILRARVNAQLRRSIPVKTSCIEIGRFQFDFDRMEFRKDGQAIELSKTEQKLLRILIENRGQTLSRGMLVDKIWTDGAEFVDENALSVTVKRLRSKLEDTPSSPRYLKTVYGIGYTWAVK
ncbi:MAG: response regulator transcription factor [Clostridiales bacterium]|nr:response regulator transcription factor [Clostridiales bacterium]